jgi:hypothetical protein
LALRLAIQEKRDFDFEIPRENARLVGGPAWGLLLKGIPEAAGGPVDVFTKDWRFARVYSGLGAMDGDSAAAVVSAIGLANLIVKYSTSMAEYGEAVALAGNHVAVPGGVEAQPAWARLAGANPQTPAGLLFRFDTRRRGTSAVLHSDSRAGRSVLQMVSGFRAALRVAPDTGSLAGGNSSDVAHRCVRQNGSPRRPRRMDCRIRER